MVEDVIRLCLTLFHEMAPPANIKMYPEVDLRSSEQPPNQNLSIQLPRDYPPSYTQA